MIELSMHILDIAENSTRAGATLVSIKIIEDIASNKLSIEIEDNGEGMGSETLKKVVDPFYTSKKERGFGLGLPMLCTAAKNTDGHFKIESTEGTGTKVIAGFSHSHIDRQPLGNISETMITLIAGNPDIDFLYTHQKDDKCYILDTREIKKEIEDIPLPINYPDILHFIRNNIKKGLEEIGTSG